MRNWRRKGHEPGEVLGFQATWVKIPERDRHTVTGFWRSRLPPAPGRCPCPIIQLNSVHLKPWQRAACRGGHELLFCVDFLDRAKRPAIYRLPKHVHEQLLAEVGPVEKNDQGDSLYLEAHVDAWLTARYAAIPRPSAGEDFLT